MCNGQLLPIQQNQALFSLLGTNYGGNGQTTFALPDLRSRVPIHFGNGPEGNFVQGQSAGTESHFLSLAELPAHTHFVNVSTASPTVAVPTGQLIGAIQGGFNDVTALTTVGPAAIGNQGGNQAHENRQPFLALNYCIALQGIFPSRN